MLYNAAPKEGEIPGVLAFGSDAWKARNAAQASGSNYTDPYGYTYNYSSSSTSGPAGGGSLPARETVPGVSSLTAIPESAKNYPVYLRNFGENLAQQKFQAASRSFRPGDAAQQYQAALTNQNMDRLNYMGQAGQQEADLGLKMQALIDQLYGQNITQRGQDIDYMTRMAGIAAQRDIANSRSGVQTIGGGNSQKIVPKGGSAGTYRGLADDIAKDYGNYDSYLYSSGNLSVDYIGGVGSGSSSSSGGSLYTESGSTFGGWMQ